MYVMGRRAYVLLKVEIRVTKLMTATLFFLSFSFFLRWLPFQTTTEKVFQRTSNPGSAGETNFFLEDHYLIRSYFIYMRYTVPDGSPANFVHNSTSLKRFHEKRTCDDDYLSIEMSNPVPLQINRSF